MRKIVSILLALALVLSMSVMATTPAAAASTWYVTDGGAGNGTSWANAFGSIGAAISAVTTLAGDTIMVAPGTYPENVTVSKAGLTLKSATEHGATIESASGNIITIAAANVTVDGFELDGSGQPAVAFSGIYLNGSKARILNNSFLGNTVGAGGDVTVPASRGIEFVFGGPTADALIQGNYFTEFLTGVFNQGSWGAVIDGNTFDDVRSCNANDGVGNVTYTDNTFIDSHKGISFGGTTANITGFVIIEGNNFVGIVDSAVHIRGYAAAALAEDTRINFNSFNSTSLFGVENWSGLDIDATLNWWGNSTGPYNAAGNPGGTGADADDDVTFMPWLMEAFGEETTQTNTDEGAGAYAATGNVTANATAGDATTGLTVAEYVGNPTDVDPGFQAGAFFFDVYVEGTLPVELVVQVNCPGADCTGMQLVWFDGVAWQPVVGVPGPTATAGVYAFTLNLATSSPTIAQLTGTPFALGDPIPVVTIPFVDPPCTGVNATYTFTYNTPCTLHTGSNYIYVQFPDGTGLPATWKLGDIKVDGLNVLVGNIFTVNATTVKFMVPGIHVGPTVIVIKPILNPAPGTYSLLVWSDVPACEKPVASAKYVISPAYSTYKFVVDFSDTYAGLAEGFIPPFKAFGQPGYGEELSGIGWATEGSLNFTYDVLGCAAPCANATMWFELKAVAFNSTTTFIFGTETFSLTSANVSSKIALPNIVPLAASTTIEWPIALHFDRVGDYEICFYVQCTTPVPCGDPSKQVIATFCMPIKVHQDKEAYQLEFGPKWNLMSLPLVPFETDIDSILAAMNVTQKSQLKSIWNYDRCTDEWFAWGNGQTSLTDIEDGKAYWVRMLKPGETGFVSGMGTLWVFGTYRPMPPAGPPSYPVCEGPNMVGFLPPWDLVAEPSEPILQPAATYLFNFYNTIPAGPEYGMIYGWSGTNWVTQSEPGATLDPGDGYWIVFERDGVIYP